MKHPLWYPYAQMQTDRLRLEVVSAEGVYLHLADGRQLIDAVSSWWCMIHGYNHPELNRAAKEQIDRMAHVMLGGLTHPQAESLARKLIAITPEGLNHVFFADSGSVGVEVALKMALQFWQNLNRPQKSKLLALTKAYHGDTTGAMSVCDPEDGMHSLFSGILPEQLFADAPAGGFEPDEIQLQRDIAQLEKLFENHHEQLAGFILEPILQAAGGFHFYSPRYLQAARQLCDAYDVFLICDEVATGFGRTGKLFAVNHTDICPDIMILGKALTGGYIGHSATLATTKIFDAFLGDSDKRALMHGPTFMANPLACAIALKSIELFERDVYLGKIARIESMLKDNLPGIQSNRIKETRVLGACGVIELIHRDGLDDFQDFVIDNGIWLRPLNNIIYIMPPYTISHDQLLRIIEVVRQWFKNY